MQRFLQKKDKNLTVIRVFARYSAPTSRKVRT
ncbi:hypothetical protein THOG10_150134 [Vibrio rotiferianus]|nr:hypothetical protein THOG10_150134 [Vibrio rotiferianus]